MGGGQVMSRSGSLLGASVSMIRISSESWPNRQIGSPTLGSWGKGWGEEGERRRETKGWGDRERCWKPKAEQEQITNGESSHIASESSGLWQLKQVPVPASAVLLPLLPREFGLGACSRGNGNSWLSKSVGVRSWKLFLQRKSMFCL